MDNLEQRANALREYLQTIVDSWNSVEEDSEEAILCRRTAQEYVDTCQEMIHALRRN